MKVQRNDSVHVLNLVDGERARIVSADDRFEPMTLHYAETCIVPNDAGEYWIESDGEPIKVILACVRNG